MTETKESPKKEVTKKETTTGDLGLQVHEINLQIDDLKLAITSLTKGLKGVYNELDTNNNRINKVADRLGL